MIAMLQKIFIFFNSLFINFQLSEHLQTHRKIRLDKRRLQQIGSKLTRLYHFWSGKWWFYFILTSLFFALVVSIIALQERNHWQHEVAKAHFERHADQWHDYLNNHVASAVQSLQRLKTYISIFEANLNATNNKRNKQVNNQAALRYLNKLMAENLQQYPHHFNHYFALESDKAKLYFDKEAMLAMVYKNINNLDSAVYNHVDQMKTKQWTDQNYLYNRREDWYHLNKNNEHIQFIPIYKDKNYTQSQVFGITQGLYENHQFKGVIGVSILVESLFSEIEKARVGRDGGLLLINHESGMVLTQTTELDRQDSSDSSLVGVYPRMQYNIYKGNNKGRWQHLLKTDQRSTLVQGIGYQPELYRISTRRIQHFPWTVLTYQAAEEELQDNNPFQLLILACLITLTSMFGLFMLYRYYYRPIKKVRKQLDEASINITSIHVPELTQVGLLETRQLAESIQNLLKQWASMVQGSERNYQQTLEQVSDYRGQISAQAQHLEQRSNHLNQLNHRIKQYQAKLKESHAQIQKSKAEQLTLKTYAQKTLIQLQEIKTEEKKARQAKSRFLANMNLELRTPMNAIIGYTEILQEDAEDLGHHKLIPDLQKIHGASYHLLELINNLFDLSRLQSKQMQLNVQYYDITPMLQDINQSIQPLLTQYGNQLKLDIQNALGSMYTDQTKVRQILLNLLSNASKYSHNTEIVLKVTRTESQTKQWISFNIKDQGIGMSQRQLKQLNQVIEDTHTTDYQHYNVAGIGLTLTRQFCELMDGTMQIQSKLGQGTSITIKLPAKIRDDEMRHGVHSDV